MPTLFTTDTIRPMNDSMWSQAWFESKVSLSLVALPRLKNCFYLTIYP